jgi:ABC-type bacteriocin/lantibiotic exporter with double-glycine peptidase domain
LEDVLKGINLNIRPGEKIGVVGRTGSGKSTTIMSLLRLLQTHSGEITIDGADIYARDLQSLRAGFSVILQEHFLFSGTVREVTFSLFRTSIHSMPLRMRISLQPFSAVVCGTVYMHAAVS